MSWGWRTKPRSVVKTVQWFKRSEERRVGKECM